MGGKYFWREIIWRENFWRENFWRAFLDPFNFAAFLLKNFFDFILTQRLNSFQQKTFCYLWQLLLNEASKAHLHVRIRGPFFQEKKRIENRKVK